MLRLRKDDKVPLLTDRQSIPQADDDGCSYDDNSPYVYGFSITCTIYVTNYKRKGTYDDIITSEPKRPNVDDMPNDNHHRSTNDLRQESPVAMLSNVGNTCYLNSVLYTLRFTPSFLHNLHHLIGDLAAVNSKTNQTKAKSSSLGRNVSGISGTSSRSPSTKDLPSMGMSCDATQKSPAQIVTEKLHDVFVNLHNQEEKNLSSPYAPNQLLQAVKEVNEIFDGNQQQDAHELLVYLLDNVRSTCELLVNQLQERSTLSEYVVDGGGSLNNVSTNSKMWSVRKSWKKNKDSGKKQKDRIVKESINEEYVNGISACVTDTEDVTAVDNGQAVQQQQPPSSQTVIGKKKPPPTYNFVVEDFEGTTLRRTRCLECEQITERKEFFYDICVPVPRKDEPDLLLPPNDIYRLSCVTAEKLCDTDKYWCENCLRYNEARREVSYERLPNLMILQLKRFSTTSGTTEKVTSYLPTPLKLACFCEQCCRMAENSRPHSYQLCSVIMHIGGNMLHGHYIAYTRTFDQQNDYKDCSKGCSASSGVSEKSGSIFNKLLKPKSSNAENPKNGGLPGALNGGTTCKSKDCCGIKLNKPIVENAANNCTRRDSGPMWLECDDDNIKAISSKEFEELLSYKPNSTSTPYLLFYAKTNDSVVDSEYVPPLI